MQAGFCTTDISLPIGCNLSGGYVKDLSTRVNGALKIRAAVFFDGKKKTAFAAVDSCGIDEVFIQQALDEVKRLAKLEFDAHIIAATHVHTGGHIRVGTLNQIAAAKEFLEPEVYKLVAPDSLPLLDEPYYRYCISQLASALIEAYYRLEEVEISVGKGHEAGRVFSRRFLMKNGRRCTHPGKLNPDIVAPEDLADPEVNVLSAWRPDGSLAGCIVNFGCHGTCMCTTGGSHGDWFLCADRVIKKLMGEDTGVVIFNAPCGDMTQVDANSPRMDFGLRVARELGGRVGAEVYKVLLGAWPRRDVTMSFVHKVVPVAKRRPSKKHFEEAVEILKHGDPAKDVEAMFARTIVLAEALCRKAPESSQDFTAIQIGEALFLSNQNEIFARTGRELRSKSKFEYTFLCTLANGECYYVPPRDAFDKETGGGYETRIAPGRLAVEAVDVTLSESLKLMDQLTPDAPVKIDFTPRTPWSYGSNTPQVD